MLAAGRLSAGLFPRFGWLSGALELPQALYPAEGALTEEETARRDELVLRAEGDDIEPAEAEELDRLTAILDGDYTPEQKRYAGVVLYLDYGGELRATHAMVLPIDQPAAA